MIGVGGLHQLLRAAPPSWTLPPFPSREAAHRPARWGPAWPPPAGPGGLAGQPGPARLGQLAELVWDHFGVQNGIVGHQIMILWCSFGAKTSDTSKKSENLWFWTPKSEILVPKGVNLEGFLTVLREKSMKMLIFDEILWNLNDFFDQKRRTRVKKVKNVNFWSKMIKNGLHLDR